MTFHVFMDKLILIMFFVVLRTASSISSVDVEQLIESAGTVFELTAEAEHHKCGAEAL